MNTFSHTNTEDSPSPSTVSHSEKADGKTTSHPSTQPAQPTPPKKKVDRSAFVSQTQPVTAPSEAKQTKFPLRKPGSKLFFRVSPDPDSRMFADVIEGNMGKIHVVGTSVTRDARLNRLVSQAQLVTCINEKSQCFVWPIKTGGRDWYKSALDMAREAETQWIRIEGDSFAQGYRMEDASAYPTLAACVPEWPLPPSEILDETLANEAINEDNDPVFVEIIGKHRKAGE